MATLEDTLHADLDELSDNEPELVSDVDMGMADVDDLDSVLKLQKSRRYAHIMQKVGFDDAPELNKLLVDCNQLSHDIEKEIVIVHNFIRDKYRPTFPELESLVPQGIDYARVVKIIDSKMDINIVDLQGLLPSAVLMAVSVTALTTKGNPLPKDVLQKTIDACDRALHLDAALNKVSNFVQSKMGSTAPNLGGFGLRMCTSGTHHNVLNDL